MKRSLFRALIAIGGGLFVIAILVAAPSVAEHFLFYPPAPTADFPPPADETQARLQDLDYLEKYVRGYDRSYSTRARVEALDLIDARRNDVGSMTFAEFELAVSRVVALADNGHSNVWSHSRARRHPALPVHGYWFDDGYYIVGAAPAYAGLLGTRIVRIGTASITEVIAAFRDYYGGLDSGYYAYNMPLLIQNTDFLHALGFVGDPLNPEITVALADATESRISLKALPPDPERKTAWAWYWLRPGRYPAEDSGAKKFLADDDNQPPYLQQGELPFQWRPLPELAGLYVQFRQNNDAEGHSIADFVDAVRTAIREMKPQVLVVDQRHNGGGDYTTTADLMFEIPELLPDEARIYAITGFETFSAGISNLGFLKHAAGDRLRIVGRRMGDSPVSWGETNDFVLPNSGIGITAARGFHDQLHGCYDWLKCYWKDFQHQVAVGSLEPDHPVPFRFSDYALGIDLAMDRIRQLEAAL